MTTTVTIPDWIVTTLAAAAAVYFGALALITIRLLIYILQDYYEELKEWWKARKQ